MKRTLFLLLLILPLKAQSTTFTLTGPATAKPGTPITLTLAAAGTTDTGAAAVQWTMGWPTGYTAAVVAGAADTGKTLSCTAPSATCIVWALNTTVIPNGQVAIYTVNVPANATGTVTFTLSALVSASPLGSGVTSTAGATYTATISPKEDLNGDGKVDLTDVQLEVNQALLASTTPSACTPVWDTNGDGKCDVLDVLHEVLKVMGLI